MHDEAMGDEKSERLSAADQEQLQRQLKAMLAKAQAENRVEIKVRSSKNLLDWFVNNKVNVLFTTASASKLFCLTLSESADSLQVAERNFNGCMALAARGPNSLYLSTRQKIWRLENAVPHDQEVKGMQKLFIPRHGYVTGECQALDFGFESSGGLIFVNSLFSCLATVSERHSFTPLWKPRFVSQLISEQRCFLSGLAMADGKPKYVTAFAASDEALGWQQQPMNAGILMDVPTNEVIVTGLNRPFCPRLYQDQLWLADSASGYLGYVDLKSLSFHPVTFCPGRIRSVDFVGQYAVVGVSRPQSEDQLLLKNVKDHGLEPSCGIFIIDLNSGERIAHMTFDQVINEVASTLILPDLKRSAIIGLNTPEMGRMITVGAPRRRPAPGSKSKH